MTTIETTSGPTAEALREWFLHDSWTIAQGLALLIDVDPARVDFVDSFYDGSPWVAGPRLTPDEHSRIAKLARLWQGKPEHTCLRRAAPSYFIEWAESKGLPPQWLAVAQAAGIVVPTQPAPTAAHASMASSQCCRQGLLSGEQFGLPSDSDGSATTCRNADRDGHELTFTLRVQNSSVHRLMVSASSGCSHRRPRRKAQSCGTWAATTAPTAPRRSLARRRVDPRRAHRRQGHLHAYTRPTADRRRGGRGGRGWLAW